MILCSLAVETLRTEAACSSDLPDYTGLQELGDYNVKSLCFEDLKTYMRFVFHSAAGQCAHSDITMKETCLLSVLYLN